LLYCYRAGLPRRSCADSGWSGQNDLARRAPIHESPPFFADDPPPRRVCHALSAAARRDDDPLPFFRFGPFASAAVTTGGSGGSVAFPALFGPIHESNFLALLTISLRGSASPAPGCVCG